MSEDEYPEVILIDAFPRQLILLPLSENTRLEVYVSGSIVHLQVYRIDLLGIIFIHETFESEDAAVDRAEEIIRNKIFYLLKYE